MMKLETHAHTAEVSKCGRMPAEQLITLFHEAGYTSIVVTDHLPDHFRAELSMQERIDGYLAGYRIAREVGEKLGIHVLLGAETRLSFLGDEDFLVYGLTEDKMEALLVIMDNAQTVSQMHDGINGLGCLMYQAHPYRRGLRVQNAAWLDGMEVYNGNPRHDSHNDKALAYAKEHSLPMLSGSDAHQVTDIARGGVVIDKAITNSQELLSFLRETADPARIEDGEVI